MKKVLLLVVALAALALPTSAGASVWTWNGSNELEEGQTATQQFEGTFGFAHHGYLYGNSQGAVICEATIEIEAEGPSAGRVVGFDREVSKCDTTGHWSYCEVSELSSNVASGWAVDVSTSPRLSSAGNLQVTNSYEGCGIEWAQTKEFAHLDLVPTLDSEGRITQFTLEGTETSGFFGPEVVGQFTPVESPEFELGLK